MKTKHFLIVFACITVFILNYGCTNNKKEIKLTDKDNAKVDSLVNDAMKQDSIKNAKTDSIKKAKELKEQKAFEKTKAGRIWKKHPEWDKEDCKLLAENKIWIGMDISMVKYLNGAPNHRNVSNYGNGSEYQYCWTYNTPSCFYCKDDGIVYAYN